MKPSAVKMRLDDVDAATNELEAIVIIYEEA